MRKAQWVGAWMLITIAGAMFWLAGMLVGVLVGSSMNEAMAWAARAWR